MDTQREEFLDRVRAGLRGDGGTRRGAGIARKAGAVAATVAATGSLLALGANTAQAEPVKPADVTTMGCSTPDAIPQSHDKWCQFINYVFDYTGQSHPSPAGGICYVFDVTIFHVPCGGTVRPGLTESCTF